MVQFADLNEDVLTLVLSHLENHRPTLRALTLTCSPLSRIATPLLYRTIRVSFRAPGIDRRFELLLRTLNKPGIGLQLISHVRNVHLSWTFDHQGMRDPDTIEFLHMIEKTRKLTLITYRNSPLRQYNRGYWNPGQPWDFSTRADLSFWDVSKLKHLQELELSFANPSDDLARFMCLTPVDVITVRSGDGAQPEPFPAPNLPRHRKPLTKLSLYVHYSYPSLANILVASAGVRHLELYEPGIPSGDKADICMDGTTPIMGTAYSPRRLPIALGPLHQTLETLEISSFDTLHWPRHDGTRLDLSSFACLTRLTADSKCFFPPSVSPASRESPAALVPPSLTSLTLAFDTAAAALGPSGSSYHWLLAFLLQQRQRLPHLRTLRILELHHSGSAFCQVCVPVAGIFDWDPPADAERVLRSLASDGGLEVTVKLRVWRCDDPDDDSEGVPGVVGSKEGPPVRVWPLVGGSRVEC